MTDTFGEISVAIAVSEMAVLRLVEESLGKSGFRNVAVVENLEGLTALTKNSAPDLIIADRDLPGGAPCKLYKDIRCGAHGLSPFSIMMTLVGAPSPAVVRGVVDSGCDAVIVKPFDAEQMMDRIRKFGEARKPFVVTHDYIGPDRRGGGPREGAMEIEKVRVPNPMRNAITGQPEDVCKKMAARAQLDINAQRVERYAFQACFLIEQIVPQMEMGNLDDKVRQSLTRLKEIADDLMVRLPGTPRAVEAHKLLPFKNMVDHLFETLPTPDPEDIQLIGKLGNVMAQTFEVKIPDHLREKMGLPVAV